MGSLSIAMTRLRSLFITLFYFVAAARAALTINWPATIVQNTAATVSWDGEPPFSFAVFSVDNTTQVNSQIFQLLNTNDTTTQWIANVAPETTVFFFVSDSTAAFVQSDNVVVSPAGGSQSTSSASSTTPVSTAHSTTTTSSTARTTSTTASSTTSLSSLISTTSASSALSTSVATSSTTSLPDTTTPSPSPSPSTYTQPPLSSDHSLPYIIGIICGVVALVIIGVAVRFFLKRRKRLQQQAAAAASQMRYWDPSAKGDGKGGAAAYDAEKGIATGQNNGSTNATGEHRASASSEDLLMQQNSPNSASTVVPLHASPYGSSSQQSPPMPPTYRSPGVTSLMLPPPTAFPNPFADTNTAPPIKNTVSTKNSKASRSSDTLLTNARASSVFLPLNDEYEEVDLDAGPSSFRHNFPATSSALPPTSWKVGQIVSQHGELIHSPTPTNAPKSASADALNHPHQSSFGPASGPYPSFSLNSRASSIPPSPSPFDDVVFDLGALPPATVSPLGRNTSTRTTTGVRKLVGKRERTTSSASRGEAARNLPSSLRAQRSPPANFPSDAHDSDEDDGDDFEYDNPSTPTPHSASSSSVYSTASTSTSLRAIPPVPPVPPLNLLSKLQIPATTTTTASSNTTSRHRSIIPSPPPMHESETPIADSPTVPMTAQSDGEFVRHMLADVFGSDEGHGDEVEPSLPTRVDSTKAIPTPALAPAPIPTMPLKTLTTSTSSASPSRRPRQNWI